MTSQPDCPVSRDIRLVLAAGDDLTRALRRLRRSRRNCRLCPASSDCQVWREFESHIDAAIQEVARLWSLDQTLG